MNILGTTSKYDSVKIDGGRGSADIYGISPMRSDGNPAVKIEGEVSSSIFTL